MVRMNELPKILLLGDYSNCHQALSTGLRALGCDVTVASDGTKWMQCDRNVDITRPDGKLGGLFHYMRLSRLLRTRLTGFDVVAIHDPQFGDLKPKRLRPLFDLLKRNNGSVFLTAMSYDVAFLDMLAAKDSPLAYNEWFVGGEPSRLMTSSPDQWAEWHTPELVDYQNYIFDNLDGAVSVLYEYQLGMERRLGCERASYGGIPIDMARFTPVEMPDRPDKIRFFLGRHPSRKLVKGSDYLEIAARRVVERYPDKAELVIVENRPFNEFTELLRSAHVVLDQIYSYTPATTALMAMAYGLNVVSGGEPDFYDFIGEKENRPIINAPIEIEALTDVLERIVKNPEEIRVRGLRSREFVKKHNDSCIVARRFLDFWNERRFAKS